MLNFSLLRKEFFEKVRRLLHRKYAKIIILLLVLTLLIIGGIGLWVVFIPKPQENENYDSYNKAIMALEKIDIPEGIMLIVDDGKTIEFKKSTSGNYQETQESINYDSYNKAIKELEKIDIPDNARITIEGKQSISIEKKEIFNDGYSLTKDSDGQFREYGDSWIIMLLFIPTVLIISVIFTFVTVIIEENKKNFILGRKRNNEK